MDAPGNIIDIRPILAKDAEIFERIQRDIAFQQAIDSIRADKNEEPEH